MIKEALKNSISYGEVDLSSGKGSNYYIDVKSALTNPIILKEIAIEMSKYVYSKKIAGDVGAAQLVTAVSLNLGLPYVLIRKKPKPHGNKSKIIGEINEEDLDILEDAVTTGISVLRVANILRSNGAKVSKAICVVDREEGGTKFLAENGIELIRLFRSSDLVRK